MMTRITSYTKEESTRIVAEFFEKFKQDKRPFKLKLKSMYLPKGNYSSLLNATHEPSKHTLEILRAYLEGRKPKHKDLDPLTQGYCCCCERVIALGDMRNRWECKACRSETERKSNKKNSLNRRVIHKRYKGRFLIRGPFRSEYLLTRRKGYLTRCYGRFAPVMELIRKIRQETLEYEKERDIQFKQGKS